MPETNPAPASEQVTRTARANVRYGLILFAVYLLLYGIFVVLNAFRPQLMDWIPAAGVNLAIWYGFGLIISAFVLALIYAWLCRVPRAPETRVAGKERT